MNAVPSSPSGTLAPALAREAKRNMLVSVLGRGGSVGLNFLSTLAVIHFYGPRRYGIFLVVLTVVTLPDLALEIPVFEISMREIAKAQERAAEWLGVATLVRGSIGTVISLMVALAPCFLTLDGEVANCVRMGALLLLFNSFRTPVTYFRARLKIHWELGLWTLARALELGLIVLIARAGGTIAAVMGAKAAAAAFFVAALWWATVFRFGVMPRSGLDLLRTLATSSLPLAAIALLFTFQLKGDVLLIDAILGPADAGSYGAVTQITEFFLSASNIMTATLAPLLARALGQGDTRQFQAIFERLFNALVAVLPGVAAVSCVLGAARPARLRCAVPRRQPRVSRPRLVRSDPPHRRATGAVAMTLNLQRLLVKVEVVNLLVYVTVNLLLLSSLGTIVSAWTRLAILLLGQTWTYAIIRARSGYHLSFRRVRLAALSAGIAAAVTGATLAVHPVVAGTAGVASYVLAMKCLDLFQGSKDSRVIVLSDPSQGTSRCRNGFHPLTIPSRCALIEGP